MAISFSEAVRNARLDAIAAAIDAGAGAGTLKFYTSPRPDTGEAITTQTLLATLTFSDPSADPASGGVLTLNPIAEDSSADATGTATWARIQDSDGNFVADVNVGMGGGSDIQLVNNEIETGQALGIQSSTITEGNA